MYARSHACSVVALVALIALVGCGSAAVSERDTTTTRVASAARVAVLPSTWITEPMLASSEVDAALAGSLEAQGTLDVVGPTGGATRAAAPAVPSGCDEDPTCVRAWGNEQHAASVAHARLAGLGSTVVVRARLIDVAGRAREQTQEEVVQNATRSRVREAVARLGRALAPAPPDAGVDGEPWYEAWWLWTIVGAVVLGGAAAVIVVAATSNDRNPDFVITPP